MAYTYKYLANSVIPGGLATGNFHTAYTCPSGKTVIVTRIFISNPNTSGLGQSYVGIVPSGVTASAANLCFYTAVSGGQPSATVTGPIALQPGDSIIATSSLTNTMSVLVFGMEIT